MESGVSTEWRFFEFSAAADSHGSFYLIEIIGRGRWRANASSEKANNAIR
jgi:hypothetical protein